MTPGKAREARRIALSRADIEYILIGHLGWEDIDVTSFWSMARRIARERGSDD